MADCILRGGEIIDGRGGPRYAADIVIRAGKIDRILPPGAAASGRELDISRLVVAPGFIDMHAHSDLAVLADEQHLSKVAQGITLEVVGQDGIGYAPVTTEIMAQTQSQIEGWNGRPELDYSWRSVADYLDRVDRGAPVNVAVLVPHGSVRMTVMGTALRAATAAELAEMRAIIARGLADGAVGLSTGLTYAPGMYASDDEILHALGAVKEHGGFYCPHHRNYGSRVVAAYTECLQLAERAGVPIHLAHCHINFPANRGRAVEVLAAIDEAAAAGLDVTLDSYPYLAGATYLAALLPSWAHADGDRATMALLGGDSSRRRILKAMEEDGSDGHHGMPIDWSTVSISSVAHQHNDWAVGKTISELGVERGAAPGDVFAELLMADELGTGCLVAVGNEENVRTVMTHQAHTVGTDGILVGDRPHPRGWGTFPRFLGSYARDLGLMSLEEAVAHATSRPARRLGLEDRGVVAEGFWADLVIFDPDTIASPATYENPKLAPVGIHHVFVNGEMTLEDGRRTKALPGRGIRRAS